METPLNQIPVIVIAGPTAVGKTELSIRLAHQLGGEIINGDSLQVYKHLNIGTGKVNQNEMQNIPHHLLDILEVHESFNASQFRIQAIECIQAVHARGKIPIVVGGTGLYLEGLLYELEFGRVGSQDEHIRTRLQSIADEYGAQALWNQLYERDPKAASTIPYQNVRRIIRALEVIETTNKLFSDQMGHAIQQSRFEELFIALDRPRAQLYERINQRVELMVEAGLESEARWLYEKDPKANYQSTKGIGYKEWWPYFEGQSTQEVVKGQIQQNSRRYAKRQLTWFRNRMKQPMWIDMTEQIMAEAKALEVCEAHLLKVKEESL